jgi:D-glycero-D-manno-heptose 1,7-bisphosphate phosphatase
MGEGAPTGSLSAAAFLDRDGTIVRDRHYLGDPDGLELLPNAVAGLRRLRELGYRLVVVTNQSGVARGYFELDAVERVNERLRDLLAEQGIELDGIYVCPHGPDDGCSCRKPAPGLILTAADELGLDLGRSVTIGDREPDVGAGRNAGTLTVAIGRPELVADHSAADLLDAAAVLEPGRARG